MIAWGQSSMSYGERGKLDVHLLQQEKHYPPPGVSTFLPSASRCSYRVTFSYRLLAAVLFLRDVVSRPFHPRRELATVARPQRRRHQLRNEPAGTLERNGERRLELAAAGNGWLDTHRLGRADIFDQCRCRERSLAPVHQHRRQGTVATQTRQPSSPKDDQ